MLVLMLAGSRVKSIVAVLFTTLPLPSVVVVTFLRLKVTPVNTSLNVLLERV